MLTTSFSSRGEILRGSSASLGFVFNVDGYTQLILLLPVQSGYKKVMLQCVLLPENQHLYKDLVKSELCQCLTLKVFERAVVLL